MSYCINLDCSTPKNPPNTNRCQACGASLKLRDRYRAIKGLGRGGFGATFLARDEALPGRPPCVIKQLRPSADAPQVLEMARDLFQREAKILGKIGNHPQIPRLLDYFETNHEFFLVQEFINGNTLQQEVRRGGPFSEAGVKQYLSEILPLIQYVHSSEVIHRDIKPANIIRREEDKKLVLIDFGAVKDKVNPTKANSSEQTALTAYAIGTPGYAPPEQMAMRPVYASDLYAVGVTCIYLLTGKSPKELDYDPTTGEMLWREYVQISDHFAGVLRKLLEISVRHRYQTVEAIFRDLDLEPYMDSLAKNMAFPTTPGNSPGPSSDNLQDNTDNTASPMGRMAAAIRARRERAGGNNTRTGQSSRPGSNPRTAAGRSPQTDLTTGGRGSRSGGRNSGGRSSGRKGKLTVNEVKLSYGKGQRDFSMSDLPGAALQKSVLAGANFTQSKLQKADFQGCDLATANFGRADLTKASFRNAKLGRAYFSNANLQEADLRGADLNYASLTNTNLRGANLCGANLTGARVTAEQLAMARTNWSTIYPNGKRGLMQ